MTSTSPMPQNFVEMQQATKQEIARQREVIAAQQDVVNNPEHYRKHPSGVECVTITEHMGFCLGNVIKYVWRADLKGGIEDLKKARWYIDREIKRREAELNDKSSEHKI